LIPVTKTFLPPKAEYDAYLQGIREWNWLTNNGPQAMVLPKIKIEKNVIISAGTVVTIDVPDGVMVVGVPGRII